MFLEFLVSIIKASQEMRAYRNMIAGIPAQQVTKVVRPQGINLQFFNETIKSATLNPIHQWKWPWYLFKWKMASNFA